MLYLLFVKMLMAVVVGVAGYAIWYWAQFNQWCPAMWHGTAPPIIVFMIGAPTYQLLNKIWPSDDEIDD